MFQSTIFENKKNTEHFSFSLTSVNACLFMTMHKSLFGKNIRASCPRRGTGQNLASRTSFLSLYVKVYS